MAHENDTRVIAAYAWVISQSPDQGLSKIVNVQDALVLPFFPPVSLIAKRMYAHILEPRFNRQPILRPKGPWSARARPCLPAMPSEAVYEYDVGYSVIRLRVVERMKSQRVGLLAFCLGCVCVGMGYPGVQGLYCRWERRHRCILLAIADKEVIITI